MIQAHDVQGILLSGYSSQPFGAYMFLSLGDGADAGTWLAELCRRATPAADYDSQRGTSLNVALTYKGLARWGLSAETLGTFSRQFIEDMSSPARAQLLGDEPDSWAWGKQDHRIHVVLMLFARDSLGLSELLSAQRVAAQGCFDEVLTIESQVFPFGTGGRLNHEHFGFVDGLAQPQIAHYRPDRRAANGPGNVVNAGEFILGYENEYPGQLTASPHLRGQDADPAAILPAGDLGRNGTYLVMRQMEQDVAGFWTMLRNQCAGADGSPDVPAEEALAAKIVGRWRDGTPVTLFQDHDGADPDSLNNFGFSDDASGERCPLGAHIRRANPREMLLADPTKSIPREMLQAVQTESIATVKRHRLLRRGRPYGQRIVDRYTADGQSRGLVFATLNANIERQFEFVQQAWITSPNFAALYDEADPLLGGRTEQPGAFSIPKCPVRQRRSGIVSHITVKGGAYFFLPGISALRYLSQYQRNEHHRAL